MGSREGEEGRAGGHEGEQVSYNIDSVLIVAGAVRIRNADLARLKDETDKHPEACFLEDLEVSEYDEPDCELEVPSLQWTGDGSGWSFDYFKETVVPCLRGQVDLVLIWEGGDSVTGIRIQDGKAIDCDVGYVLTPRAK